MTSSLSDRLQNALGENYAIERELPGGGMSHIFLAEDRTQYERDVGERQDGGLSTPESEELKRLRRENRQLKMERDILSKAAAWFARETGTIPDGSSGS